MSKKRVPLGRGLDAVLGDVDVETVLSHSAEGETQPLSSISPDENRSAGSVIYLDPHILKPNPNQPRTQFDETALAELAASIKEHGIIQPVIATETDGQYFILAGERRTRAALLAGLEKIPVLVSDIPAERNLELALIENIQRQDLTPVEEAKAYKKLLALYDLSHDELAKKLGKSRSSVTNVLRLLQLPDYALEALQDGSLSAGHARALLSVLTEKERRALFDKIISEGLSVREAERYASHLSAGGEKTPAVKPGSKTPVEPALSPELADMQQRLLERFGTKVKIKGTDKAGTIELSYFSADDLNALYEKLLGQN